MCTRAVSTRKSTGNGRVLAVLAGSSPELSTHMAVDNPIGKARAPGAVIPLGFRGYISMNILWGTSAADHGPGERGTDREPDWPLGSSEFGILISPLAV